MGSFCPRKGPAKAAKARRFGEGNLAELLGSSNLFDQFFGYAKHGRGSACIHKHAYTYIHIYIYINK